MVLKSEPGGTERTVEDDGDTKAEFYHKQVVPQQPQESQNSPGQLGNHSA